MYYVITENHAYSYEIYEIITLYFPGEKISLISDESELPFDCMLIKSKITLESSSISSFCSLNKVVNGHIEEADSVVVSSNNDNNSKKSIKHGVKLSIFSLFKKITGIEMPWGILVGIRPTKIVNDLKSRSASKEQIVSELKNKYLLTDSKIKLVTQVSDNSYRFINNKTNTISLYIGIPFCPTRCLYCSFASYSICKHKDFLPDYMEALKYEILECSRFINNRFEIESIYVGGGTPTSLDEEYFKVLLGFISNNFDTKALKEYTVEAGRPDTLNQRKLELMKESYVSRISINPQSMNNSTLNKIGREHTVEDTIEKFKAARAFGFDNINMDMIIGLPGEDIENVESTVNEILHLSPENITVHTMAVKRASRLKEEINDKLPTPLSCNNSIIDMMDLVSDTMDHKGYIPYYMYRQKNMIGNLENVGYCKPGYECLYNIQMIEEKETIIGVGADSVTKLVFHDENRIERYANKKDLKEYINTIHEHTEKKLALLNMLT